MANAKVKKKKKPSDEPKKPQGRPTDYNEEIAREICDTIAETTEGLKSLCESNPHWPCYRAIRNWLRLHKSFMHLYAQAKLEQADYMLEECFKIADNTMLDSITKTSKNGEEYEVANNEWINRSRLRVDLRKWAASKLAPKLYGDRLVLEKKEEENAELLEEISRLRKKLDEQNRKDY